MGNTGTNDQGAGGSRRGAGGIHLWAGGSYLEEGGCSRGAVGGMRRDSAVCGGAMYVPMPWGDFLSFEYTCRTSLISEPSDLSAVFLNADDKNSA